MGQVEITELRKPKYGNGSMEMAVWKWKYGNGSTEVRRKAACQCLVHPFLTHDCGQYPKGDYLQAMRELVLGPPTPVNTNTVV